jgi:hypothetical protein
MARKGPGRRRREYGGVIERDSIIVGYFDAQNIYNGRAGAIKGQYADMRPNTLHKVPSQGQIDRHSTAIW